MHYSLSRATAWNIAGYAYLLLASLISTPILVHSLGLVQFGQYSLIVATLALVSAINLGLPQSVTRALARARDLSPHRQSIWATSSSLFILTGIVSAVIAVIITVFYELSSISYVLIFALALLNNLVAHYTTLPQSEGHFGYYNTKTFVVGTGNTLLAAFLSILGYGLTEILLGQLACYLVSLFILAYFSLKFFPHPRAGSYSSSVAHSLLNFGYKNQVGTIVGQIQGQYAKYLLAPLSPLTLSAYVIGQSLVYKLAGGVNQLASALYPAAVKPASSSSFIRLYHRLQLGLFLVGLLAVGSYSLLGFPFLTWWLHSPALVTLVDGVMRVFVWYFAILVLTPLASSVLDASGRPELTSFFAFLTAACEIALSLVLFPSLGLMAPVYAALIATILTTPPLLWITTRVLRRVT